MIMNERNVSRFLKVAFGCLGATALLGSLQKPHALYVAGFAILVSTLIPWNNEDNRKPGSY